MNDLDMRPDRLTNGGNGDGRDGLGRFVKGCAPGPGNPSAKRVAELRQAFIEAVNPDDVREIVADLIVRAKAGEPWAVREVLDRTLGRPSQAVEIAAVSRIGSAGDSYASLPPERQAELDAFRAMAFDIAPRQLR